MPKLKLELKSFPGPETIVRRELSNGLIVLVRENHTSPAVVIDGDVRVGALWEPRAQAGLADFTASALMRGNAQRDFAQIYEDVESIGASLGFGGGTHTTSVHGKSLAEDLGLLLEIAAASLRHPTFPADHIERLRGEWLTRLAMRNDDTRSRASQAFYELAYPDHPYSVEEDGYLETIRAITREDVVNFHAAHYGPRHMLLTLVGAIHADEAIALVEKYFGDWVNPAQPVEPALPPSAWPTERLTRRVVMPGKTQSDILLGGPGPARSHPHFLAARLANNVLGIFGMGGRIGHYVREKGGMAYYAGASLNGGLGPGAWYAYAGVNPKNVDKAISLIEKELKKIIARAITPQELADTQTNFIGRMPLSLETNEGVASSISTMELYGLGLDYLQRYPAMIRAITRDEALAVTREFWRADRFALAVAGPE